MSAAVAALRRLARQPPRPDAMCGLCAGRLDERHEHVLEIATRRIECSCTACALLFDRPGQALRRIGRDARALPALADRELWDGLGLPVELAFVTTAADAGVVATFPSALGAVEHAVEEGAWITLCDTHPLVAAMQPDVEALLLDGRRGRAWIVPIDRAYALVGHMRESWRGLSGGAGAQAAIDSFLAELPEPPR